MAQNAKKYHARNQKTGLYLFATYGSFSAWNTQSHVPSVYSGNAGREILVNAVESLCLHDFVVERHFETEEERDDAEIEELLFGES